MDMENHILIESEDSFKTFMKKCRRSNGTRSSNRAIGCCDVKGPFEVRNKIGLELCNQTIAFENFVFYGNIRFKGRENSKVIFDHCEFINLQRDFNDLDKLSSGSIYCLSPTRLEFSNCKFQNCKNILDLNENGDNVLFEQCRFEKSSFFTSDKETGVKNTRVRFNQCTFEDSELTVLILEEVWCLRHVGEEMDETSETCIVDIRSLPISGSE